jgi:hypothetical protein
MHNAWCLGRTLSALGLWCAIELAAAPPVRADMQDAADFPAPHSRCMHAAEGRLLTSVGPLPTFGQPDFEVVADTRLLKPDPSGGTSHFEDPSLSIFNDTCELVWHQSYPSLAEVGFRFLRLPGRLMLHVSAISVFQPVDQVISDEELLEPWGDTVKSVITFGGDRYESSYIGPISASGAFGMVTTRLPVPHWEGKRFITPTVSGFVRRWQAFVDPDNRAAPPGHAFVGPVRLNAKALAAFKLPVRPPHPPFPLYQFVFGEADPG